MTSGSVCDMQFGKCVPNVPPSSAVTVLSPMPLFDENGFTLCTSQLPLTIHVIYCRSMPLTIFLVATSLQLHQRQHASYCSQKTGDPVCYEGSKHDSERDRNADCCSVTPSSRQEACERE